jgi:L-ribulose-5-phosphate 3-epimerase
MGALTPPMPDEHGSSAGKLPGAPGTHKPMRFGYNTNGFAHHRLEDAIDILAELGYRAIAITPDVHHLPPFSTSSADLRALRRRLEAAGLVPVIETGARYVLDARAKHRPNLLDPDPAARARRLEFYLRCATMAAELGGHVISIWSGRRPVETAPEQAGDHLLEGVRRLCDEAAGLALRVGFEPEPGMWVETLAQWERLRDALRHPALGLTLDTGHVPCTESFSTAEALERYRSDLVNVHLDDGSTGVHDHLQLGEGELEWGSIFAALKGYRGVASVELSRHSHDAPRAAATAIEFWRGLEERC